MILFLKSQSSGMAVLYLSLLVLTILCFSQVSNCNDNSVSLSRRALDSFTHPVNAAGLKKGFLQKVRGIGTRKHPQFYEERPSRRFEMEDDFFHGSRSGSAHGGYMPDQVIRLGDISQDLPAFSRLEKYSTYTKSSTHGRPLKVLDVGSGKGETPLSLHRMYNGVADLLEPDQGQCPVDMCAGAASAAAQAAKTEDEAEQRQYFPIENPQVQVFAMEPRGGNFERAGAEVKTGSHEAWIADMMNLRSELSSAGGGWIDTSLQEYAADEANHNQFDVITIYKANIPFDTLRDVFTGIAHLLKDDGVVYLCSVESEKLNYSTAAQMGTRTYASQWTGLLYGTGMIRERNFRVHQWGLYNEDLKQGKVGSFAEAALGKDWWVELRRSPTLPRRE